jgi:hypothetical protein
VGTYKVRIRLYDKEEAAVKLVVEGAAQPGSASTQPRQRAPRARKAEPAAAAGAAGPSVKPESSTADPVPDSGAPAPSADA